MQGQGDDYDRDLRRFAKRTDAAWLGLLLAIIPAIGRFLRFVFDVSVLLTIFALTFVSKRFRDKVRKEFTDSMYSE